MLCWWLSEDEGAIGDLGGKLGRVYTCRSCADSEILSSHLFDNEKCPFWDFITHVHVLRKGEKYKDLRHCFKEKICYSPKLHPNYCILMSSHSIGSLKLASICSADNQNYFLQLFPPVFDHLFRLSWPTNSNSQFRWKKRHFFSERVVDSSKWECWLLSFWSRTDQQVTLSLMVKSFQLTPRRILHNGRVISELYGFMTFHQSDKETSLPYQIKEKYNVFAYNFKKRINGQANVFLERKIILFCLSLPRIGAQWEIRENGANFEFDFIREGGGFML